MKYHINAVSVKEYVVAGVSVLFFFLAFVAGSPHTPLFVFFLLGLLIIIVLGALIGIIKVLRPYLGGIGPLHIQFSTIQWIGCGIAITCVLFTSLYILLAFETVPPRELWRPIIFLWKNILLIHLVFAWLTFFCFSLGRFMLTRFARWKTPDKYLNFFVSFATGLYALILFYFLLAQAYLLNVGVFLLAIVTILMVWRQRDEIFRLLMTKRPCSLFTKTRTPQQITTSLMFAFIFLGSMIALFFYYPIATYIDDLLTYINIPLLFIQHGGYVSFPYYPTNEVPYAGTYLLIPLLQLFAPSANIMNAYLFIISSLLLAYTVRVLFPSAKKAGLYAIVVFATFTMNAYILHSVRPDMLMLFTVFLACTLLLLPLTEQMNTNYSIAGFLLGFAIAVKYNSLFAIPAIIIAIVFKQTSWKKKVLGLTLTGFFAIFAFSPWGITNIVRFNNMMHPFRILNFNQVYSGYSHSNLSESFLTEFQTYFGVISHQPIQNSLEKILLISFPGRMWATNRLGPILVILLFMILIFKPDRTVIMLSFYILITLLIWLMTSTNTLHYIYFSIPFIAILFGYYSSRFKHTIIPLALCCLLFIYFTCEFDTDFMRFSILSLAEDTKLMHEMQRTDYFKQANLINQLLTRNANYLLLPFDLSLYLPAVKDNDKHFYENNSYNTWFRLASDYGTADDILANLRQANITHILMRNSSMLNTNKTISSVQFPILHDLQSKLTTLLGKLPIVSKNGEIDIYELPRQ